VFSFYATKNLTTGEGGMVCTEDDELAEQMRVLRLHGITSDAWKRYSDKGSWYYEVLLPGYKYNMTDVQASLGLHQLVKQKRFQELREEYARIYTEAFAELPEIEAPYVEENVRHAWHLYIVRLDLERLTIDRGQFLEALRRENVGASVHFIPLHLQPFYQKEYGFQKGDYPVAERVYEGILSLPLYPKMTRQDVDDVIEAVSRVISRSRR
jgi:dTDP-4-amino-4,6-dideoxygalactose transaminase